MYVAEFGPAQGQHFNGRIQLHGARSQGDHAMGEGKVFPVELVDVPHEFRFAPVPPEQLQVHEIVSPAEPVLVVYGFFIDGDPAGIMFLWQGEYLDELVHIGFRGGFIQGDADGAVRKVPEVDLPVDGVAADLFRFDWFGEDDLQRVEEVRVILSVSHFGKLYRQGAGL